MSTAEYLPDNINMVNEDGDVVPRESEPHPAAESLPDVPEADHSAHFFVVENIILSGIEKSQAGGYRTIKVSTDTGTKPLGQFMSGDLYKYGLSKLETDTLREKYLPSDASVPERRAIGRVATAGVGEIRTFDPKELASGLHKEFDD